MGTIAHRGCLNEECNIQGPNLKYLRSHQSPRERNLTAYNRFSRKLWLDDVGLILRLGDFKHLEELLIRETSQNDHPKHQWGCHVCKSGPCLSDSLVKQWWMISVCIYCDRRPEGCDPPINHIMFRCAHVQWLDIDQAESRWTLTDPDRLRSITKELPNAEQQYPSLVFFIGKRVKTVALRDIYTSNNVTRRRAHGLANLLVDVKTYTSDRPIIFADCTPGAPCTSLLGPWGACHENHRHTICENSSQLEDMVTLTHVNLFFPFTHVVCIFADDLGGNRACARYIEGLTRRRAEPLVSCTEACPHLLVVTTGSDALDDLVQVECHDGFHSVFESFQILTLDEGTASSSEKLKTTLQHVIDDARQLRRERHLLFTAVQLAKVFARASEMFSQEPVKPVNLLAAAQHPAQSLSAEHVAHHIKHFLSLSAQHLSRSAIVEHIASALIVQGYPSGIHRKMILEPFVWLY